MSIHDIALESIIYPDSDGKPMADNTKQFHWIVNIEGGLEVLFKDDPDVFVAGDLLWYPVENNNTIRAAPDALVAFGRPKGHRGSYKQWEEGGIAPQVVFEVLSPGNTAQEMLKKLAFYERYGVEEYYLYDPDRGQLSGWIRSDLGLQPIPQMQGWTSPRLQVRFELDDLDLCLYGPDGKRFASYLELDEARTQAVNSAKTAEQRAKTAEQRAKTAEQRAKTAEQRAQAEAEARRVGEQEIARLKALLGKQAED